MIETNGKFYLGRIFDPQRGETTLEPLLYDPDNLTTHAVVVGMTGSGKTGLCIDLLEEAALNNIPALMIDPKGDITNALLHFPDLLPSDFEPWVNADEARREGKSVAEVAAATAELWRNGLAQWHITPDRIRALQEGPRFAIYTPGSDAGLPVSILASLAAPDIPWEGNRELLREKISGTVTALLGLLGFKDVDPVRSREHILLSNIFEHAWSQGKDLDLSELIMQTQSPPFAKLGVFDVNQFFPEKDRFELAMMLNNILASPAFQTWIEGEPLDIGRMLYDENGRPRHTIFYIAHLSDEERMFFVTLFYSAVESWMRTQSGTTSLRALVYFDEIFGYLPPVGNPPSKEPMLRLLKQARAFGVGMVLATQNPVDIDYKALSNAGTWFIGKLGTEQDKERLLDGLASAVPGGLDKRAYADLISALGKRVFLLRNVHEKHPLLFQTRWAMNYLAGPVTRIQIPALNALAGAHMVTQSTQPETAVSATDTPASPKSATSQSEEATLPGTSSRPAIPGNTEEYFLPSNLTPNEAATQNGRSLPPHTTPLGILYRPVLLAQTHIRFLNRKYNLDHELDRTTLVPEPNPRGTIHWEDHLIKSPINPRHLDRGPLPDARFTSLEAPFTDSRTMRSLKTDFADWAYRTTEILVKANESLKVYAGPEISDEKFAAMCQEAAAEKAKAEAEKVTAQFQRKMDTLTKKLKREERELKEDEEELAQRKREELGTHAETLLSLFGKRRRSISSSLSKRRLTAKAKADVEESLEVIAELQEELAQLEEELKTAIAEIENKWAEIAADVTEIPVTPYKKDVDVTLFGVAWFPYHLVETDGRIEELPAFAPTE
ncbi:MAG: ATP-binding protein [Chloroflexi bacterium]|nr:MAG: ATP-binding protein [Chloroflexota bacterium]